MGSPFKMKPKTPMMKALVGKQGNLPQHLKEKILAAPETAKKGSPAKSYGSKTKSPVMKKPNPYGDVVLDTKTKEVKRKTGGKNIVTTETVEKGMSASRRAKLEKAIKEGKGADQMTRALREGYGRMGEKTYVKLKGTGGKGAMVKSKIYGTKGMRTLSDGSKVMIEDTAQAFKKKGLASPKPKARALQGTASRITPKKSTAGKSSASTEELKKKKTSPVQKYGKGLKKKPKGVKAGKPAPTPVRKMGVKALEAQRGTKNPSPLRKEHLKKKDTKGKNKLPDIAGRDKEGNLKAKRGPRSGSIGGVRVSIQTKGRSTKNTDLLQEGKKLVKSLTSRGKGSGARAKKRSRS